MNYTIKQGRIAGIQFITTPEKKEIGAVYMSKQKQPEAYFEGDQSRDVWETLPLPVQAAINRQFGIIFSLPYSARENFVLSSIPFEVTA
jgi:hypothetical protein